MKSLWGREATTRKGHGGFLIEYGVSLDTSLVQQLKVDMYFQLIELVGSFRLYIIFFWVQKYGTSSNMFTV